MIFQINLKISINFDSQLSDIRLISKSELRIKDFSPDNQEEEILPPGQPGT